MMAHRVRYWKRNVIGFSYLECSPYGADFDGDEMNIHALTSARAVAEAMCMTASVFYAPTMRLIQDGAYSTYSLSMRGSYFDEDEFVELIGVLPTFMRYPLPPPIVGPERGAGLGTERLWCGRQILQMILAHTHLTLVTGTPARGSWRSGTEGGTGGRDAPSITAYEPFFHPRVYAAFVAGFGAAAAARDEASSNLLTRQFWAHVADIEEFGPEGAPNGPHPSSLPDNYFAVRDTGLRGSRLLAGRIPGNRVHEIVRDINNTLPIATSRVTTASFLDALAIVSCPHLRRRSLTASFSTFIPEPEVASFTAGRLDLAARQFDVLSAAFSSRTVPPGYSHAAAISTLLSVCMDDARAEVTPTLTRTMLVRGNHILRLATAAAKGTNSAMVDVAGFVGQQNFGSTPGLPVLQDEARPFAWCPQYSENLSARGVVLRCLTSGLSPLDMKNMGSAAEMNLAKKAHDPRRVGYMTRTAATHMADFAVTNYQAVRDPTGTVLSQRYGVGITASWMRPVPLRLGDYAACPRSRRCGSWSPAGSIGAVARRPAPFPPPSTCTRKSRPVPRSARRTNRSRRCHLTSSRAAWPNSWVSRRSGNGPA
jgi:hypothetical protein